jgi:glycosyltransferase involved in cell wall biosynthesis
VADLGAAETSARVLIVVGTFEPGFRGGGPIRSIVHILESAPPDMDIWLVTRDRDVACAEPYPGLSGRWVRRREARVFYVDIRRPRHWLGLWRDLRRVHFDLLYCNSFWSIAFTAVPIIAARLRLIRAAITLLAPRGELFPAALRMKARKKRIFIGAWSMVVRWARIEWHASNDLERTHIRRYFPTARIEVVPDQTGPPTPLLWRPIPDGPLRLIFLSRISPMKNLRLVLASLAKVAEPVRFDIYGPVEDASYWADCQSLMTALPSNVEARYHGPVQPERVRSVFADHEAFVFPTLGENFGHVIAESLSASCPVICSAETPWTSIVMDGGGAVLAQLTTEHLAACIASWAASTPDERQLRRRRAGWAYEAWHRERPELNILERMQSRSAMASAGS